MGLLGAGLDGMESDVDALGSVTVAVLMEEAQEVERARTSCGLSRCQASRLHNPPDSPWVAGWLVGWRAKPKTLILSLIDAR